MTVAGAPGRDEASPRFAVWLNSPGGDIRAALAIGRMIRAGQAATVVTVGARCASACVLILGAGVVRAIHGDVVVHRPYFGSLAPGQTPAQVQQRYRDMRRGIDEFALEMNLPGTLVELMFSVPPERGRILSRGELDSFTLDGADPAFDEQQTARDARAWRLTSAEFRRRTMRVEQSCRRPSYARRAPPEAMTREYTACRLATMANTPLADARQLIAQAFPSWPGLAPIPWRRLAELDPSRPAPARQAAASPPPQAGPSSQVATSPPPQAGTSAQAATPPTPSSCAGKPTPAAEQERDALLRHIYRSWSAPPEAARAAVALRLLIAGDGAICAALPAFADDRAVSLDALAVADAAIEAIRRATGLPVPRDRAGSPVSFEMTLDPRQAQ
jgi:hypothetical protein